jgi:hypothetical protein
MSELIVSIAKYGIAPVAIAAVIYIIVRGELSFRYPRK